MRSKIFISYRREDTAANALGIGQYLEHQFGRKNVFIDVDMRAGTKFPDVLQQRLAECKVLLALIGPNWLSAHDEQGRRLDRSDDWVRLEIAHALRRSITVIPVRVNGAVLPTREELPDDIRGLLDHQAVSVTTTGFRNEMAGLARDIRAIPSAHMWRHWAAAAASVLVILAASALIYSFALKTFWRRPSAQTSPGQSAIWSSEPGEWVMFAFDNTPAAWYFKPSSVKIFGDNLEYTARFPLKIINETEPSDQTAVYKDDEGIVSCKTAKWAQAEVTYYNRAGQVISHFKRFDPSTIDMSSVGQALSPTSIGALAQHLLCDEQLRTPLLARQQSIKLSFLSPAAAGDGDIFYGAVEPSADKSFPFTALLVTKLHQAKSLANDFPGQIILGLPPSYQTAASRVQIDCADRKAKFEKTEDYDADNNLIYVIAPTSVQAVDITEASPLTLLLNVVCTPSSRGVEGTYKGTNKSIYKKGGEAEQEITIHVIQTGNNVTISFQTPTGGQGKGEGNLSGDTVKSLTLQNTAPECPGSYKGSLKFERDTMSWSYEGSDCGGSMEGSGTGKRTKT
ncbi:MAG TPA: toll/interleukin-1 receptor domain-containing protein [Xanthobacteraceae bacterium]